ncbi:MAG TPA: 4-amino-4-deoxy-L-arabinose transferase, partial [Marmoricola sp.]
WRDLASTLVWVETDPATRLARGLARDGEEVRPRWERWMADEARLFAEQDTRTHADLLVVG